MLTHTQATAHTFTDLPGERYTFRVTATDHVGNAATAERVVARGQITKYYYHGGQRVALRQGQALYFLHPDHLGSTSLTTDAAGHVVARRRYAPYGQERWATGDLPTDFGFTGQRDVPGTGLMYYRARYYDPALGRFVSADTVVPSPSDPQSLNRYAYVRNNPLKYTDPSGHNPWPFIVVLGGAYLAGRAAYEAASIVFIDSDRRDQIGGQLVTNVSEAIQSESTAHSVDPVLVGAVLRHESAAFERRLLTLWPTMQPGVVANTAEYAQTVLRGDTASIGPGQMQLRRARELEELGYVALRNSDFERRKALLGGETSVEYVAGMLQYLGDQLSTLSGFSDLSAEDRRGVTLIAYNWGWTEEFRDYINRNGFWQLIQRSEYDNQTLDEYLRWSSEQ